MEAKTLLVGEPLHGTLSYAHDMAFPGVIAVVLVVFHSVNNIVYPVTTGTTNREPLDACGVQPRGFVSLTAVVISIDRLHRIGPICCLLFDRIGVRQPGIAASASSQHWVNETSNWVCSDTFLPIGNLSGCGSC